MGSKFGKSKSKFRSVMIIDTCNGILVFLRPNKSLTQAVALLVNPFTKSCFTTPPLPRSQKPKKPYEHFFRQFTLVCVPHIAKFKIFFIDLLEVSEALYYVFYVLTIGIDNSWREIDRKKAALSWFRFWKKPSYDGGNYLYWISPEHGITMVDVDKEIIVRKYSLPPVPIYRDPFKEVELSPRFVWMGNQLSCIVMEGIIHETFQIYLLDFDSGKWSLYHDARHLDYVAACAHELNISYIIFRNMNFSYSVKTRKLTKIEGIPVGDIVTPHTSSLISLPSTPT